MTLGYLRDFLQINESAAGIGKALDENCARFIVDLILKGRDVFGISPAHMPIEVLEGGAKLVHRAAIELARSNEVAARLHERVEDEKLSRVAGGCGKRRSAAFKGCNTLFQNRLGGVHDARIDVAESLQTEQRCRMLHVVEHVRRGLIDRRRTRTRRW